MEINLSLCSLVTYIVSKVHVFLINKNSVMRNLTNTIYNTTLKKAWEPSFFVVKY